MISNEKGGGGRGPRLVHPAVAVAGDAVFVQDLGKGAGIGFLALHALVELMAGDLKAIGIAGAGHAVCLGPLTERGVSLEPDPREPAGAFADAVDFGTGLGATEDVGLDQMHGGRAGGIASGHTGFVGVHGEAGENRIGGHCVSPFGFSR